MTVLRASLLSVLVCCSGLVAQAAPRLNDVRPRGLQAGQANVLTLSGRGFSAQSRLVATFAIKQAKVLQAKGNQLQLRVEPAVNVPPGFYVLWVSTPQGVSNPAVIAVDGLRQQVRSSAAPIHLEPGQLPVAITGRLRGAEIHQVTFPGRAGEHVVVEVEAQRLGSSLRPAVEVVDQRGVPLGYSQWSPRLHGDARLVLTLPSTGRFTVKLHDVLYRGGGFYRLKLGQFTYADGAFPLVVKRGEKQTVGLVHTNATAESRFAVQLADPARVLPLPWHGTSARRYVAPAPPIRLADIPQAVEPQQDKQALPVLTAPVGINAVLASPGQVDRFRVKVTGGKRYRVEVLARRAGSPLDSVLVVRTGRGKVLGQNNDQPRTLDSKLDVAVPKDVSELVVEVRDQLGQGGAEYVYHVSVRPLPVPRVGAQLDRAVFNVPAGGVLVARVTLSRQEYGGPVRLVPDGSFPPGLRLLNATVPSGANQALIALRNENTAKVGTTAVLRLLAQDTKGRTLGVVRGLQLKLPVSPWLATHLAVQGVEAAGLSIAWKRDSLPRHLERGTATRFVVQVKRLGKPAGPVRLRLLTSQVVPTVRRGNTQKPDVQKALRLESPVEIPAGEKSAERPVVVVVPATLPQLEYDLVLQAELLSPDKKRVLSVASTEPLRLDVARQAVRLQAKQNSLKLLHSHRPVVLAGKVIREGGFQGPVLVRLEGLPQGSPPMETLVLPGEDQFRLPLRALADWAGKKLQVRLTASGLRPGEKPLPALNPQQLTLTVPAKVQSGPLRTVLDDELGAIQHLAQKHKQPVRADVVDAYSGSCSLELISGKAELRPLPWLGATVSRQPTRDQVRYLRWAWRAPFATRVVLRVRGTRKTENKTEAVVLSWQAGGKDAPLPLPREWTVVTQDLAAQAQGPLRLESLELEADRGPVWLDHVYLAAAEKDFQSCPAPRPGPHPLRLAEDEPEIAAAMTDGRSDTKVESGDVYTGLAAYRASPPRSLGGRLFGPGVPIREKPGPGEYRYICFAWKAIGGDQIYLEVGHEGQFGPRPGNDKVTFRYRAGPGSYLAALPISKELPGGWVLVVRDLYQDFGQFTLTGLGFTPFRGQGLYDHVYLGKSPEDFKVLEKLRP